jgi:hypothetical protein
MFNCQECGACCSYFHIEEEKENNYPMWGVAINPNNHQVPQQFIQIGRPLEICDSPEDADNGISYETTLFMKTNALRCVALVGEIGTHTACEIYENRPSVCRHFEAGSDKCLDARTLLALSEVEDD